MHTETPISKDYTESIRQRIHSYISDDPDAGHLIKAVYLFGSILNLDQFKTGSDVDLAYLIDPPRYKEDPLIHSSPAHMSAAEIGMLLNRQTDVIVLNAASIETAYQVVTTGIILYEADRGERLEYESTVRGLYYDFKPFLQQLRQQRMLQSPGRK